MKNIEITNRIKKLIEEKNVSPYKLWTSCNIPKSSWSYMFNNKSDWRMEYLAKIAHYFDVSLDWLIQGKEDTRSLNKIIKDKIITPGAEHSINPVKGKLVPLFSGTGCGNYTDWEGKIKDVYTENKDIVFKVVARGGSMEPEINDGDILDCIEMGNKHINNDIVVVSFKSTPEEINSSVKYITWDYPNKNHIMLRSANLHFQPSIISKSKIYSIYKVTGLYRKFKIKS